MLGQLALCLAVCLLVFINQVCISTYLVRLFVRRHGRSAIEGGSLRVVLFLGWSLIVIAVEHLSNVALWALAALAVDAQPDFRTAFTMALANYTTLGGPDPAWNSSWTLLPPFQALTGVILFAWSISLFYSMHMYVVKQRYESNQLT
ncbi:hypothetical protein JCM15519_33310 [Fundidesulfovibrio butyratiphilus]